MSGKSSFWRDRDRDSFIDERELRTLRGTFVIMTFDINSTRRIEEIIDEYAPEFSDHGFTRTVVPVELAVYEGENLVSRSQAKRLYARFEKFREIILDFKNVKMIGQAFADQLFRVFQNEYPTIKLIPENANRNVLKMITRARSNL